MAANNAAVRKLNSAGVETSFSRVKNQDRVDVYEDVCQRVQGMGPPFRTLHLKDHPDVAIEALHDQVALRSPAKRKNGVKTGASDIASMRLAQIHAGSEDWGSTYVIVSDDIDVKKMADWGETDVRIFPNIQTLRLALLDFQPIEIRRVADVYRWVVEWVEKVRSGESVVPEIALDDIDKRLLHLDHEGDYLRADTEVSQISDVLALQAVDVDDSAGVGTATVYVRGSLTMTGWQLDENGDQLVGNTVTDSAALIVLSVSFLTGGAASDLTVDGVAAHASELRFEDDDEAFASALEFMAEIPGFGSLLGGDGSPAIRADGPEWSAEVNGKEVLIELVTPHDPNDDFGWEWKLRAEVGDKSTEIACHFQDTWSGGNEGEFMEPPHVLGGGYVDLYSVSEFLMSNLYANETRKDSAS